MQDDDSWRDAFSANAGLFLDDASSSPPDYGPLLAGDIPGLAVSSPSPPFPSSSSSSTATSARLATLATIPQTPLPIPSRAPFSTMTAAALGRPDQQRQQQGHHLRQHQKPNVRVQIASLRTTLPPSTTAAASPVSDEPHSNMQTMMHPRPPPPQPPPRSPPQQHHRQGLRAASGPVPLVPRGVIGPVLVSRAPAAGTHNFAAARSRISEEGSLGEQADWVQSSAGAAVEASPREGESFTRKRDRAKLLRQQMNEGLDDLHEALVEISTSGANPSASGATSLIPIRGPRRAAVVACSAELVRELISTCVDLRAENASLSERLAAALAAAGAGAAQGRQGGIAPVWPPLDSCAGGDGSSGGERRSAVNVDKRGRGSTTRGAAAGREGAGEVSAHVFGQLLSLSVFGFLGPQSLVEGRRVSREWRDKCAWDCNWSNLCRSRWRLGPEQQHAEVWRVAADTCSSTGTPKSVVSPPAPPPSWRSIYSRLHRGNRTPTGALSSSHLVIGKSIQQGIAIWIALSRRSNGMTGRSVKGHGSAGFRTTEVVELRAVVQRVDEGPSVRVHPNAFTVRRVSGLRAYLTSSRSSFGSDGAGGIITTTGVFPPVSHQGESRFSPRFTINTGASETSCGSIPTHLHVTGDAEVGMEGDKSKLVSPAMAQGATPPLALYDYATVDFFIEAAGCPTESSFLSLESCVDVVVSGAATARGKVAATANDDDGDGFVLQALSVGLTEGTHPAPPTFRRNQMRM